MSITFFCPEAPTVELRPYEDEPELVLIQSTLPEANFSNANARALMRAAGFPGEECGEWTNEELPQVQSCLIRLVNSAAARRCAVRPTMEYGGELRASGSDGRVVTVGRGCTVVDLGTDDEGVRQRAGRLLAVVAAARTYGGRVVWG